jgi:hypothetical protein
MAYPISVTIAPQIDNRDRLTAAFRIILALPHILLVGGVGTPALSVSFDVISLGSNAGILGAVASLLAIVSWFTILLTERHVDGFREFTKFVLQWRARSMAYMMLLVDRYPPFGGGEYPATMEFVDPKGPRDRLTVGLRLILAVPHFVVLFFLMCGWWIASVVAWLSILFTRRYPDVLIPFAVGTFRWTMRVDGYLLLLVDEYPPFTFNDR